MKYIKEFNEIYNHEDLRLAILMKNKRLIKDIVDSGVDLNKPDKNGYYIDTAMNINDEYMNMYDYLISLGMKPDNISRGNLSVLLHCAKFKSMDWVYKLIKYGASLNIRDNQGRDIFDILDKKDGDSIKKRFPEEYQKYLIKKDMEKYNL